MRNNDELYARKDIDAVIIATADFQHARHGVEAVNAGAMRMSRSRPRIRWRMLVCFALRSTRPARSCRSARSAAARRAYQKADEYIQSGKFGDIVMVEMTWNVNQPGRWRRPDVVPLLKEEDTDWKRYLINRPHEPFDARKYLEFRLFWPYSSGIPDQWLVHQIDTVHWFTGLPASAQRRGQRRHLSVEGRAQELGHDDGGLRLRPLRRSDAKASRCSTPRA